MEDKHLSQLEHKRRTITDLSRHLENRTDKKSNYIMLLGAGASVTSGIRTGKELVEIWKKEVYEGENNLRETEYKPEDLNNWFKKEFQWFDETNEYSSLFEKRFDLPAQRRNFIEAEVSNKIPFIGYAYLVKLVSNNFINTILTTNFDDLLNEAFYHYGGRHVERVSNRPIICAHDSTINSINIYSERPKIIKLHGDYLYDNIKSSLRETESLETNIKNKFIEFSKNKGLVVIGYSGADRSIMDTINFLLNNEDYLKHGVYWCIRKGDKISHSLKKLLWKDKVYFIEIDGFDELMAELNYKINNEQLPIEPNVTMENYNFLIENIIQEDKVSHECSYIKRDIEKLNKQNDTRVITEFFETIYDNPVDSRDKSKSKRNNLTIEEEVFLLQEKRRLKNYDEKISEDIILNCKNKINTSENISSEFKTELLEIISECYELKEDNSQALKVIKELEELEEDTIKYFQRKIRLIDTFEEKVYECNQAIEKNKYSYIPYVQKAIIKLDHFKKSGLIIPEAEKDCIELSLKTAIELEPSKHNMAYYIYIDFILENKKICNSKPTDKAQLNRHINKARDILKKTEIQDPIDPEVILSSLKIMEKDNRDNKQIEKFIKGKLNEAASKRKKEIYSILFNFYLDHEMKEEAVKIIKEIEMNNIYKPNHDYLIKIKAEVEFRYHQNLGKAIELYSSISSEKSSILKKLAKLHIYNKNYEAAREIIFEKLKDNFSLKKDFFTRRGEYDLLLEEIEKNKNANKIGKIDYLQDKVFALLHAKKYQEVISILDSEMENESQLLEVKELIYNKEYAKKMLGKKIAWHKLERYRKKDGEGAIEIAYFFLKDDHRKAKSLMMKKISKDYTNKFDFQNWSFFKNIDEYKFLED